MRLPPPLALPGSGPDKALLRAPAEAVADEYVFRVQAPGGQWRVYSSSSECAVAFFPRSPCCCSLRRFLITLNPKRRLCRWGSGRPSGGSG